MVITDCDHGYLDPEETIAAERGVELTFANGALERFGPELEAADALLTQYVKVDDDLLSRCPGVRVVGRYGVGVDTIDLNAAARRGITVVNVPDFCYRELADHAMTLAMVALRRVGVLEDAWRADPAGFAENWEERFELLSGVERTSRLRFGIVGFGRSGRALAQRARGFEFEVVAHDPNLPDETVRDGGATPCGIDELLATSDVVSLHLPATPETEGFIDAETLARMKDGVVLVNAARGSLVDEAALLDAIGSGKVAGAGLDVTSIEPLPPDHPLFDERRIALTPHVGFYSETSIDQLKHTAMRRVLDELDETDEG